VFEVCDSLILFADLLIPFGQSPLQFFDSPLVFRLFLAGILMLPAQIVVRLAKPVVLTKQVAEQTEQLLVGPSEQPGG
jgi:hypothetical protein